jgi:hypothetical protein
MKKPSNQKERVRAYLKYSGLAFQLAGVIGLSLWAGLWLDKELAFAKPICTIILVLVSFSAYLYKLYIDLSKPR